MSLQELLEKFAKIKVWKRGSQRAPHKPLLILYAVGCLLRQEPRLVSYEEVDQEIGKLLREFGQKINSYHPENPFCYLRTDGL